ncbi:MAG: hypothetical protein LBE34_09010 [Flavobacteriaceae bacterium]|jgi:hypothetical protein|nr:hypothetical protein [Flavobacteriaceae bacterium]
MDVKLYKPKSKVLAEYIVGFCFVNKGDEVKEYIIYPNNFTSVSITSRAAVYLRDGVLGISSIEEGPVTVAYISQYNQPIQLKYSSSPVDQLVVFFKPYGVNHFILNIDDYLPEAFSTQFCPFEDLGPTLECILTIPHRHVQLEVLELYLLSIFYKREEPAFYRMLEQVNQGMSKKEIAENNKISTEFIDIYFKGMIGKTIDEYNDIRDHRQLLHTDLVETDFELLFFDDLFVKESELLKRIEDPEYIDKIFSHLDFNPQRMWFVL